MSKTKDVLEDKTKRVLLLKTNEGELKIEIPDDAKITFGPAIPFARKAERVSYTGQSEYALRIYRGTKDNLIAVFAGVYSFRDITIPVQKLIVREAGKSIWKSDEEGFEIETAIKKDANWIPDINLLND